MWLVTPNLDRHQHPVSDSCSTYHLLSPDLEPDNLLFFYPPPPNIYWRSILYQALFCVPEWNNVQDADPLEILD